MKAIFIINEIISLFKFLIGDVLKGLDNCNEKVYDLILKVTYRKGKHVMWLDNLACWVRDRGIDDELYATKMWQGARNWADVLIEIRHSDESEDRKKCWYKYYFGCRLYWIIIRLSFKTMAKNLGFKVEAYDYWSR